MADFHSTHVCLSFLCVFWNLKFRSECYFLVFLVKNCNSSRNQTYHLSFLLIILFQFLPFLCKHNEILSAYIIDCKSDLPHICECLDYTECPKFHDSFLKRHVSKNVFRNGKPDNMLRRLVKNYFGIKFNSNWPHITLYH